MKIISVIFTVIFLLGLTACNTMEGLGKDIQKGGAAVEKAGKK